MGVLIHRDFVPRFANQALATLFGYDTPQDILRLDTILRLFPQDEHARLHHYYVSRLRQQPVTDRYEVEGLRQDGTVIWLEVSVTAVTWDGAPAVQAALTDVTARKRAEDELANHMERMRTLTRLNRLVSSGLDVKQVLHEVARAAAMLTDSAVASCWTTDDATRTVRLRACSDEQMQDFPFLTLQFGQGGVGWVAAQRCALEVPDVFNDSRMMAVEWWQAHELYSFYALPMLFEGTLLGVLALNGRTPLHFKDDDKEFLDSIVAQAAVAIRNAHLYRESEEQRRRLTTLVHVAQRVTRGLDLSSVLRSIAEAAAQVFEGEAAFRLLEGEELVRTAATPGAQQAMVRERLGLGESLSGVVALNRKPYITTDSAAEDRHLVPAHRAAFIAERFGAFMCVPVVAGEGVLGTLHIYRERGYQFGEAALQLATSLADQAAVAIEHVRLLEAARHHAASLETVNANLQREIAERQRVETLLAGQKQVLERIASDTPLTDALRDLIRLVESQVSDMSAVVMLLDEEGIHLRLGAAPGLPETFKRAVDGIVIGPEVGSCGTAAHGCKQVVVTDVMQDPRWVNYRELAWQHGFRACWSAPILDASGACLGTFAMYSGVPRAPSASEQRLIDLAVHLARLAIERHRAQDVLRESEERYRELFENANDIVYTHDLEGNFTSINKQAEKVTGYTHDEALRGNIGQIVAPEYLEYAHAMLARKLSGAPSTTYELEILTKSGQAVALELGTRLIYRGARPVGVQGIARDITERRRAQAALRDSEERYRKLVEQSPDGIILHTDGRIVFVNSASVKLLGAEAPDQLIGRPVVECIHPDFRQPVSDQQQVLDAAPTDFLEGRFMRLDGQAIDVEVTSMATVYRNRPATQTVFRDITSRNRLQAQLRQGQKMEAIGTLAGGIAHDFNNILTAILGYTELTLSDLAEASPLTRNLRQVLVAGRRAKSLVQQILTFSRHRDVERQPVHVCQLIAESLELLRASLPTTISLRHHFGTTADTILADANQIQQVLMNLCSNAEHAMRADSGAIEIRLDAVEVAPAFASSHPPLQPGPHIRLVVCDTGHGMPADILERIFEPFFTTKEVGEGSGMGLAVVHGIVTNHDGAIAVESTPGQGTTFTIYLPRIDAVEPAAEPPAETATCQRGACILFVDDETSLVDVMQELLGRQGYRVEACTGPQEAIDAFQLAPHRFDVVITDQTMPQMTGEVLIRTLRQLRPDVPIILSTGFSYTMTEEKARSLGIDAFMMKPLDIETLHQTIQQVLTQRRSQTPRRSDPTDS